MDHFIVSKNDLVHRVILRHILHLFDPVFFDFLLTLRLLVCHPHGKIRVYRQQEFFITLGLMERRFIFFDL